MILNVFVSRFCKPGIIGYICHIVSKIILLGMCTRSQALMKDINLPILQLPIHRAPKGSIQKGNTRNWSLLPISRKVGRFFLAEMDWERFCKSLSPISRCVRVLVYVHVYQIAHVIYSHVHKQNTHAVAEQIITLLG